MVLKHVTKVKISLLTRKIKINPMQQYVAAVSCGILDGKILLDLPF